MRRVFAYLLKSRMLDYEVVSAFAEKRLIYESLEPSKDGSRQYHNAIFVGYDLEGKARHAHKKGIYTMGKSYRGNLESSDPRYSFHWNGKSGEVFVFEAPIDMLSYISLHPENWQGNSYVALCGVSSAPIQRLLEEVPQLEEVTLCLDNDEAGHKAARRIAGELLEEWEVEVSAHFPEQKDWNEELLSPSQEETMGQVMAM